MVQCPVCGLGARCRNHWVALQTPEGEVEFQAGAMTASEDNLVMLRNKLKNPALPQLFDAIGLTPHWAREAGKQWAYLDWPLELRGAVHRALFPAGMPGGDRPLPPTPVHRHRLEGLELAGISLDWENCLPDEFLYRVEFDLRLAEVGAVRFAYVQLVWAEDVAWARLLAPVETVAQARALLQLFFGGLLDPLRAAFAGRQVELLADDKPDALVAGDSIDELVLPAAGDAPELHLGEEIESLVNRGRLQPLLRDNLLAFANPILH